MKKLNNKGWGLMAFLIILLVLLIFVFIALSGIEGMK